MYLVVLLNEPSNYVSDSIWEGFSLSLGAFATYCCKATVFYAAKEFILRFSLKFEEFMYNPSTLMIIFKGIIIGLNDLSDYPKTKRSFISVI